MKEALFDTLCPSGPSQEFVRGLAFLWEARFLGELAKNLISLNVHLLFCVGRKDNSNHLKRVYLIEQTRRQLGCHQLKWCLHGGTTLAGGTTFALAAHVMALN